MGEESVVSKVTLEQLLELGDQIRSERVNREGLQAFLDGKQAGKTFFPAEILCPELIPTGWEVVEDVLPRRIKVEDLKFVPCFDGDKNSIQGPEMRERAVALKANFGLSDAVRFLAEQADIPEELRDRKYIILSGTIFLDERRSPNIASLCYEGGCWKLYFRLLINVWRKIDLLPCSK
ncbi:MAG: hypothetical protein HOD54_03710 [Candidatus Magasanikbacteria bacterium]|nr:hypothetical protein [Candidatus Magasanikbacteria bacterium]MBT4315168.1 hypothetical protein [Candidatus Magasanikbacteria bacterium]MBT4547376.1 hypothetical protein [Candidatus Magasanikbacteria bacterium]